jgi:hypothetical protein
MPFGKETMDDSLTYEAFAQSLNTKFQVQLDGVSRVDLQLVEVSEVKRSSGQEEFAIVFLGPDDTFLGQGMRRFGHEHMGQFDLFIVPIRQDNHGYYYEAVFNRFRAKPDAAGENS